MSDSENTEQTNTESGQQESSQAEGEGLTPEQQAAAAAAAAEGGEGGAGGEGSDEGKDGKGEGGGDVPETYQFNVPEGMEIDQGMADAAGPVFKELGLSQEQADKLVGVYASQLNAQAEAAGDAFKQQQEGWAKELKDDKDFGGDKYEENSQIAFEAVKKFAGDDLNELTELLDNTGVGNFPPLVRMFHRIGLAVKEDTPGGQTAPAGQEKSREEKLYPSQSGQ